MKLSHAGRPENKKILVILYPLRILSQSANDAPFQSPPLVDVFDEAEESLVPKTGSMGEDEAKRLVA